MLKLDKEFFSLERDLIFVAAYLSPEGSTFFNTYEKRDLNILKTKLTRSQKSMKI